MAEDKVELRDITFRQLLPWTELFRGFQVALDPKKLLLAATGIVVMSFGWYVLACLFHYDQIEPTKSLYPPADYKTTLETSDAEAEKNSEDALKRDHEKWRILHETAGPGGVFSTLPWDENRGPNPYLLVTSPVVTSPARHHPAEGCFLGQQGLVLIEPLVKFLQPVIYLLKPNAGVWNHLFFLLVLLWTLATWALFGGAITRLAAVQLARNEKISMSEAFRFAVNRYKSFFFAPLFPLLFVLVIVLALILFGFLHLIPVVGDILIDGLFWWVVLLAGLLMAVILVGLVGWPLMYATISTEGSDSFDALNRSYSYVFQCPWHYLWNSLVAIVYGAALVFFIGFMGSLLVYLGKWGVSQTPFVGENWTDREPSYLFVYAPTSYHWRDLLLRGSPAENAHGEITAESYHRYLNGEDIEGEHKGGLHSWNKAGAFLVALWLHLVFLMVVGFGYSYFWCASSIIYLLMRREVDDTEMDEVYLEEDEVEDSYSPPPAPTSPAKADGPSITMVDAPTLRSPVAPVVPPEVKNSTDSAPPPAADGPTSPGAGAPPS